MASYEHKKTEEEILSYWASHDSYAKAKNRCAQGKPFYFLDGPPYTSGKVHLGTAWNKVLKDMVLRYKRMRGLNVWDRAGYDMHGLPTEHATMKALGLKEKEEIEKYGVAKFINECKELCTKNMQLMNESFARLGVWMDFPGAYQTISDEYIDGEWWLIKRAHDEGRLYEGLKTITWCPECASALAKHECEYQNVTEESIFVKLPVQGEEATYLIIWTTTPWTIPFNLAVMVNPELEYQTCKVKLKNGGEEKWILASALAGPVIQSVADATYTVEKEYKGEALEGLHYDHPFGKYIPAYEEMRLEHPKLHTVLLSSEYVDTSAGSGLVHCAPGCGPEDYEVGHANGLPPYNTLDEKGVFPKSMGLFAGKVAKRDDAFFIKTLDDEGALIATVPVEHDYAHCWRCKSPVIFRSTKQWFFKVEDLKEKMIKENDAITWVPDAAYNAFDSWLKNLRDNSITKQRYWGTPVPIWRCESCEEYVVVGSQAELQEHVGKEGMPVDVHKPWIDAVTWECKNCKRGTMKRVPDILDVWVDAGTASWNCLDYPRTKEAFEKLFPADFILEGKDQIRGWFNLLHVSSMIAFGKPSFKACYMHGFINDAQGRKMSKSLGNYILPDEVVEKYGANTFRYYAIGAANPAVDMNYNLDDVELKHRHLSVYWNLLQLLLEQRRLGIEYKEITLGKLGVAERYALSKTHNTIKKVTGAMEAYRLNEVPQLIEALLLDLSRTYVQLVREQLAHGSDEEKTAVVYTLATAYVTGVKLFSIVAPMFAESAWQELKKPFCFEEESVTLCDWPTHDEKMIDEKLEASFDAVTSVISAVLAARDTAQVGVRWPAATVIVETNDDNVVKAVRALSDLVTRHVNVKNVEFKKFSEARLLVKPNYKALGETFGQQTGEVAGYITKHASKLGALLEESGGAFTSDGYEFKKEHFTTSREVPKGWSMGSFPKGKVFLNTTLTPALETEGFARELIRRAQQLRKEAGLEKNDAITLWVDAPTLESTVKAFNDEIQKRTGAAKLVLGAGKGTHESTAKIKGKAVTLSLAKKA